MEISTIPEAEYELKLASGKVVKWVGRGGVDAAERYVDCFQDAAVVAWRSIPYGVFPWPAGGRGIIG